MRGRLLRVEALLGRLIEKVMPDGAEPHENSNGLAEALTDTPMEEYSSHPSATAEGILPGNYTTMVRIRTLFSATVLQETIEP